MAVHKYKPKAAPRTWEIRDQARRERTAELVRSTRVLLEQSRELMRRSKELFEENGGNHFKK